MKVARWAYHKAHWVNFEQEGLYNHSSIFWQMATSTNLLGTKVHEVQESWGGQKDLQATNQVAKASQKDIHFFQIILPIELLKIMGLKDIPSSEALQWQGGLTFCPWCGKEGQNEWTVVNHLQTMHYHLGLICAHCLDYFTTSAENMHCHAHDCKPMTASKDDDNMDEEDSEDDNNGDVHDEFVFKEDLPSQLTLCPV